MPWGVNPQPDLNQETKERMWSRRVDFSATLLVLLPPLFPLLRVAGVRYPPEPLLKAAAVHLQLVVMVGLTSDANMSVFSQVCR